MTYSIEVDHQTCIHCGKCVRICPAFIFYQSDPKAVAEVRNPENCIQCGHCVAICPTDSVKHTVFPPEKVHPVDRANMPSPEEVMMLIKARRSNRAFSKKPVPRDFLDQIVEAAYRTPTASNKQELEFTLVTNPEVIQQIVHLTVEIFEDKMKGIQRPLVKTMVSKLAPDMYKMAGKLQGLVDMVKAGGDPIMRGATTALFVHTDKENAYYGKIDGNLAYQNASLMAESLGVSQFYTGFVCRAIEEDKKGRFNELLGIEGKIHAGMGLGMPSFTFPNYIDKKEMKLRTIE